MPTIYDVHNGSFSDRAHIAAQRQIYPLAFGITPELLSYESTQLDTSERNRILDGELGIDRIVRVRVEGFRGLLPFYIQERFRRPEYCEFADLTITEWNHATNVPSELYKLAAGFFLYGYYDEQADDFKDALLINVAALLSAIAQRRIHYTLEKNRKAQSFVCVSFAALHAAGAVHFQLSAYKTPASITSLAFDDEFQDCTVCGTPCKGETCPACTW